MADDLKPMAAPRARLGLGRGDAVGLDAILLGKKGLHVADEGARDGGR
jgi:hypothetical protein